MDANISSRLLVVTSEVIAKDKIKQHLYSAFNLLGYRGAWRRTTVEEEKEACIH